MRSNKRYTNVTFTHRPDHEGGRHRPSRASAEPRICESCGAVYAKRRWTLAGPPRRASLKTVAAPDMTICKGCRMVAAKQFSGEVRVSGDFVKAHRPEIERLIHNEADRAAVDNPLQRIVQLVRTGTSRLTIRTTTEHLAQRLGHALHKAMHGVVHYEFSEENKFAHVMWSRN